MTDYTVVEFEVIEIDLIPLDIQGDTQSTQ